MILIADSGSTKTEWCVVEDGKTVTRLSTRGINPFFQSGAEISAALTASLIPEVGNRAGAVYFYGAGCIPEKQEIVKNAIAAVLQADRIEVNTDLLAAARALCGNQPGIACIMGTGSNSCFYDGQIIRDNIPPLGFILGDEGSGAVLGKLLVGNLLKNQLPPELKEEFLGEYSLTAAEIMDKVYRQPFPNRFLAGFAPFIAAHITVPAIRTMVADSFRAFFARNIKQYDYTSHAVHISGSVAYHFRDMLEKAASAEGVRLGRIMRQPMEGLISYHTNITNIDYEF